MSGALKLVVIESPFAGATAEERELNIAYAKACLRDCLLRGEAPFASHLLYTQVLRDEDQWQRELGLEVGFAWGAQAELRAVYVDRGIRPGMQRGIDQAKRICQRVEYRSLPGWGKQ